MARIRVNGVELAYEVEGSGPPLTLVHGSWTDRHGWDRVAGGLALDYTVLRYDRRGHSESERVPGTVRDDVEDLAALIDALDLAPAHISCSSYGGVIGFHLAASTPELLRSLVSHEPPLTRLLPDELTGGHLADGLDADEDTVIKLIEAGDHEGAARRFVEEIAFGPGAWARFPEPLRATFARNAATYPEEQRDPESRWIDLEGLRTFERPVLLTQGGRSPTWFGAVIERLAEVLPTVSRHVYRGAGHMPQGTHPDEYVEVVRGFLQKAAEG